MGEIGLLAERIWGPSQMGPQIVSLSVIIKVIARTCESGAPSFRCARSGGRRPPHSKHPGPPCICARDIRTDYVVVSPHNLREPSGLAMHSWACKPSILIGPFVAFGPKGPDTLYSNGIPIIQCTGVHTPVPFMWDRGPSGPPMP